MTANVTVMWDAPAPAPAPIPPEVAVMSAMMGLREIPGWKVEVGQGLVTLTRGEWTFSFADD